MTQFKKYLESDDGKQFYDYTNFIQYGYDVELQIYKSDASGGMNMGMAAKKDPVVALRSE